MAESRSLTMLLLGGSIDNANRGVSALGLASLANLRAAFPEARLIAANSGLATRVPVQAPGGAFEVETSWIRPSRSLRPRSGTHYLDMLRKVQPWIPEFVHRWIRTQAFEQIQDADVVLDISGGDSFSEIYGSTRFENELAVKRLVLAMKKPLVLLPQTFGPFTSRRAVRAAGGIIRGSLLAASRDLDGAKQLERLAGPETRPRLASCPDVAFSLEPVPLATDELPLLVRDDRGGPLFGLNVSGLLYCGNPQLPLSADYRAVVHALVHWAMSIPRSRLLLVPHVFGSDGGATPPRRGMVTDGSDLGACRLVQQQLGRGFRGRVGSIEHPMGAGELKYVIGHCHFFIGARMHSCIAAASQCIPTVPLAYSRKAGGVFGMIGAGSTVVDMRRETVRQVVGRVKAAYNRRKELQRHLAARMPSVVAAVRQLFSERLRRALLDAGLTSDSEESCRYTPHLRALPLITSGS